MYKIYSSILAILMFTLGFSQTYPPLVVNPSTITTGTNTTVVFSGGPININTGTCIEIYIQQGTTIIYQSASNVYYQASNVIVTSFYIASNTLTGAYNIVIYDWCNNTILQTYISKMSVAVSSIAEKIKDFFDFSIFPNPVAQGETLNILPHYSLSNKANSITLYDNMGKQIMQVENITKDYTVPTDKLAKGSYYIRLVNKEGSGYTKKIEVK